MLCKKRNENVYQYPYWCVKFSIDALPFSEHLQISVDILNYLCMTESPQKPGLSSDALEGFEDTKWVIRIRKSKNNRQNNDQRKKYKRTTIYKTYI
jgi:hypothetical protein